MHRLKRHWESIVSLKGSPVGELNPFSLMVLDRRSMATDGRIVDSTAFRYIDDAVNMLRRQESIWRRIFRRL